jgi:hypothetical protein
MASAHGPRPRRLALWILALAGCCLLILTWNQRDSRLFFPPSWNLSAQQQYATPRSAWFLDGGFMRLDQDDPFASYYTVTTTIEPQTGDLGVRCDQTRMLGTTVLCDNKNVFMSLLRRYGRAGLEGETGSPETIVQDQNRSSNTMVNEAVRPPVLMDLAGKRALILGDSVDRETLVHLRDEVLNDTRYFSGCDMDDSEVLTNFDGSQGAPRMFVIPVEPSLSTSASRTIDSFDFARDVDVNRSPSSLSSRGPAVEHELELVNEADLRARSQVRIDFLHMYGTDEDDLWEDRQSHHQVTAWRSRDRLEKVKSMWGTEPDTYDVVFINFGLWELARYQRTAYDLYSSDDAIGLPQEWLEDYKDRLRVYVERVQTTWSDAKVVIRTVHDPRNNAGGWFRSANMDAGGVKRAPFTRLRVVQLRRAQLHVAQALGLDALNWADRMIGQDDAWLKDEIHPAVPGSLVLAEMYLRTLVETGAA